MLDGGPRGDGVLQQCGHHREGGVRGGGCRLRATRLSGSLPLQQVMIESTFCLLSLFWKKKQLLRSALCNSCHLVIVLQQSCEIKEKLNEIQATNFTFFSMCSFVCLCTQFTLIII